MIEQLTRESLHRVARAHDAITVAFHEVRHPREMREVPGLEVEQLPALIINGEQMSAGRILTIRDIEEYINEFR